MKRSQTPDEERKKKKERKGGGGEGRSLSRHTHHKTAGGRSEERKKEKRVILSFLFRKRVPLSHSDTAWPALLRAKGIKVMVKKKRQSFVFGCWGVLSV